MYQKPNHKTTSHNSQTSDLVIRVENPSQYDALMRSLGNPDRSMRNGRSKYLYPTIIGPHWGNTNPFIGALLPDRRTVNYSTWKALCNLNTARRFRLRNNAIVEENDNNPMYEQRINEHGYKCVYKLLHYGNISAEVRLEIEQCNGSLVLAFKGTLPPRGGLHSSDFDIVEELTLG